MAFLFPQIQTIKGFSRKFRIAEDTPKVAWATITDIEKVGEIAASQLAEVQAAITTAISNLQHGSLAGVGANDHHAKYHSDSHDGRGSDPLVLPFEFKATDGTLAAKIDTDGNIFIKGRILKIT